jgi:hypothetical protein
MKTMLLYARKKGALYVAKVLDNGDTVKQLLARSRYLLLKTPVNGQKSIQKSRNIISTLP